MKLHIYYIYISDLTALGSVSEEESFYLEAICEIVLGDYGGVSCFTFISSIL